MQRDGIFHRDIERSVLKERFWSRRQTPVVFRVQIWSLLISQRWSFAPLWLADVREQLIHRFICVRRTVTGKRSSLGRTWTTPSTVSAVKGENKPQWKPCMNLFPTTPPFPNYIHIALTINKHKGIRRGPKNPQHMDVLLREVENHPNRSVLYDWYKPLHPGVEE